MAAYTTINDAGSFFNPVLYTATGSSLGVTGAGFQPDFTWIKNRSAADFHVLTDAVRLATKYIRSDDHAIEVTDTESLKSFDSDGFTVGTTAEVNTNTENYVSWNWKAGTTTGIAGSPSITPSGYSFNATSGFSIIKYEGNGVSGATLPHGLGVAPRMIMVKNLDSGQNWHIYTSSTGATKYLVLNTAAATVTATGSWNDTAPTSTVFSLGDHASTNTSGEDYVAYCFADVQGFSKFGGYDGNGDADGTIVYTGFRPAFVILKSTVSSEVWHMMDDKRLGYNVKNEFLYPDTTAAEDTTTSIDFLSNGFKLRTTNTALNNDDELFIFMAFAQAPLVNSSGIPVNAR